MARMYVIQTGRTVWDEQARIESASGAPLADAGRRDVQVAAAELDVLSITTIYASNGQAEQETARALAERVGAKVRTRKELRELDYGLWQGLTEAEIRHRQPKLFRQWSDAPNSVRPPGGETLPEALDRLKRAVRDIVKRHRNGNAVIVLRPVARALVKCLNNGGEMEGLWQYADDTCHAEPLEADLTAARRS